MRRNESRLEELLTNSWFSYSYAYFFPLAIPLMMSQCSCRKTWTKGRHFCCRSTRGKKKTQTFDRCKEQKLVRKRVLLSHFSVCFYIHYGTVLKSWKVVRGKHVQGHDTVKPVSSKELFLQETIAASSLHAERHPLITSSRLVGGGTEASILHSGILNFLNITWHF